MASPRREVIIREYDNEIQNVAEKGVRGDTELAHVNPWEAALLKRLGGVGTVNKRTGLKQFYTDPSTGLELGTATATTSGSNGSTGSNSINFDTSLIPTTTTNSNTYSGLPTTYQQQLLSAVMPQLTNAVNNMGLNINDYTQSALDSYNQTMNNAIKTNIPKSINNLANRGIIDSSVASDTLSGIYSNAATDAANKGYQTAMQAALLKANMPSVLASLADLGKSSTGTSSSYTEDPTAMYKVLAYMLTGQY